MLWDTLGNAATRWPAAVAVQAGERTQDFAELALRSRRIARWLVDQGVQPGDRVALVLDRSIEAVAAIYGVLLAGAVYVPLDPMAPPVRNGVILRDAGARVLLTEGRWGRRLKGLVARVPPSALLVLGERPKHWAPLEVATEAWEVTLTEDLEERPERVPDDGAVLLYTSGSTGVPKGVALSHRAVLAFVDWAVETFAVGPEDRVSGVSPLHFDLSTFEIFGAVSAGATAVIAPAGASAFPSTLAAFWQEQRVSVWYSVPGALVRLLEADLEAWGFPALRVVLFAGEAFPVAPLARLMSRLRGVRFANLYGPTETNVCTWYEVPGPPHADLPIGHPASGAVLHVEDGELWVAGPSLLTGYHGDPGKTAQAIVERDGQRFYRTGDRVRWGEDGALRILGRLDTMLKIQGFRVQPEEVEAALATHDAVAEVVVVPFDDDGGGKRLEARVVASEPVDEGALVVHCAGLVPSHMVPSRVVFVDALARTDRGKLAR